MYTICAYIEDIEKAIELFRYGLITADDFMQQISIATLKFKEGKFDGQKT